MVWGNADFGDVSKREVVYGAIKKVAQGWANGSTSTAIIRELGLTEHRNNYDGLSDKGLEYLIASSQHQYPVPDEADAVSVEEIMSDLWDKYSDGGTITKEWFDRLVEDFKKS